MQRKPVSQKVDLSSILVFGGSALLFLSLFLDWFGVGGDAVSAWTVFETLDIVLAALALAAAAIAAGRLDSFTPTAVRWLPGLAGAALVVVAVQLVDPPPAALGADREVGAWFALVATLLMAGGAAMSMARVSVVLDVSGRDRRRVPVVDRRPGSGAEPAEAPADPEPRSTDRPGSVTTGRPSGRLLADEPAGTAGGGVEGAGTAAGRNREAAGDRTAPTKLSAPVTGEGAGRPPAEPAPAVDPDRTQTFEAFGDEEEPEERGGRRP